MIVVSNKCLVPLERLGSPCYGRIIDIITKSLGFVFNIYIIFLTIIDSSLDILMYFMSVHFFCLLKKHQLKSLNS